MATPSLTTSLVALTEVLDLIGIAVFAASGALAAARAKQTLVTFTFFALVTGVGGGTVRDLLIGAPVFWVHDWRVPAVCLTTALLIWMTPSDFWRLRAIDWFDAIGLSVYAVFGAVKALGLGVPALPAVMMGIITACVGGVIRDVLAGVPSIILRPEIYVTAAALAASLSVGLNLIGLPVLWASIVGAGAGLGLRALAITRGLSIPAYHR
jgi:uncharacterized membrane protein YeiH